MEITKNNLENKKYHLNLRNEDYFIYEKSIFLMYERYYYLLLRQSGHWNVDIGREHFRQLEDGPRKGGPGLKNDKICFIKYPDWLTHSHNLTLKSEYVLL